MADVFISYSRDDQSIARRFAEAFGREGLTVWWDQTLKPGEAFDEVTEKALNETRAVVVLWSKSSVGSRWVRAEATQAHDNKNLLPVMIEACKRPIMFELTHTADLVKWKGDASDAAWRAFLGDVRQFVRKEGAATSAAVASPVPRKRRFGVGLIAGIVGALVVAGTAVWVSNRTSKVASPAVEAAATAAPLATASATAPIRLAVLPFAILSSESDPAYLSEGLPEDLAIELNQISALRALGPASTRRFADGKEDPRVVATALGVSSVLVGTVRRNEKHWLFTVNLIDGKDGTPRWQGRFAGDNVFELQKKIVIDVAQAVGVVLGVTDYPRTQGGTENVQAYEQYMRARYVWRAGGLTPAAAREMAPFLREAVRLDPDYKRAWLTLYLTLRGVISAGPVDAVNGWRQERQAAAKQLEKGPQQSVLALRFRAFQMLERHSWAEAVSAGEAAVAAAPANEFDSNYALGLILMCVGRFDAAIPHLRRAVEAEPLHAEVSGNLQRALRTAGRETEAQDEHARATALGVEAFFSKLPSWEEFRPTWPRRPNGTLEWPFEDVQPPLRLDVNAARKILHLRMAESVGHSMGGDQILVTILAAVLGEWELATTTLRNTLANTPEATLNTIAIWQIGLPRDSESFKGLVRDVGLADYFRVSGNWGDFCKPVGKDDFECH